MLQEALSNVARHSGVEERAGCGCAATPARCELEVEDHGKGLDAGTARRGLGLVAMRERAELVGGTLEFLQPRRGGTLVRLTVPIDAAATTA